MAKKTEKDPGQVPGRPDDGTSSQPQFSTYKENTDVPDDNPPPGPSVIQERGKAG